MTDHLRTDRLLLRRWTEADREPFAAMNADPRVMEHFPGLLTREQSDAFVDRIEAGFAEHGFGLWAVEDGFGRVGLQEVLSFTATRNLPSQRVMQRLGMVPGGTFEHPNVPEGSPLRTHVLYRLAAAD